MDVTRKKLANGLAVAVAPIKGLSSVSVLLAIEAGQWFEPTGRPGIARMCAQAMLPRGAGLVVAGGVKGSEVFESAESACASWPRGEARDPRDSVREVALASAVRRLEVVPDKTQSDVIIGWPGLPRNDPRFVAARVTNMVYAADTFASRAGHVVRDELGLAYYVFSTIGSSRGQSPWTVRMGVNPTNVERAISVALDELRKILDGKVAPEDLELAQDKLVGELDVARESPGGVASLVLEGEIFDLGRDHLERYPSELRAVTRDQVVETARSFLPPERSAVAIAGPPLPGAA